MEMLSFDTIALIVIAIAAAREVMVRLHPTGPSAKRPARA